MSAACPGIRAGLHAAQHPSGTTITFPVTMRIDTPVEWEYYRHGEILPMMLRRLAGV